MDTEKFKQFLLSGDEASASLLLRDFISEQVSSEQQAKVLIKMTSLYLEIQNTLNAEYIRIMENAIAALTRLNKNHQSDIDFVNLAEVRRNLSSKDS
jgi:hypothetical protein